MNKFFLSLLMLFSLFSKAQLSKLELTFNFYDPNDSVCYRMLVLNGNDTLIDKSVDEDYYNYFDSLAPGSYKIHLHSCGNLYEPVLIKPFVLYPNKITKVEVDLTLREKHVSLDKKTKNEIVTEREEFQINLSYIQNNWLSNNSPIKFGASCGYTAYGWFFLGKHFGFLPGVGFNYSHYGIAKDTTFISITNSKKLYEYYNYLDLHLDVKIRITFGNQKTSQTFSPKAVLDFGVNYYAPFFFRHMARYEGQKKVTNRALHQFTDFRTYVNVGIAPVLFFAEYRLADFLIGNYPEIPKYNAGIKFIIN